MLFKLPAPCSSRPLEGLEAVARPGASLDSRPMALFVVTGGAGFIGSHITRALVKRGDRVRVVDDLSSGRLENLQDLPVGGAGTGCALEFHRGDVLDAAVVRAALRGARGVFHEAAQVSVPASVRDPLLT